MKYQTEYQRNYQKRTPKRFNEVPIEERKLNEVPIRRSTSSPSRRRGRSVPSSPDRNNNNQSFAVIGPNDKFSQSRLYRLRQPVKDYPRVAKSQEYAILGRNEKFENNVAYPLRKPVVIDSPKVVVRRRRKSETHSCGNQTELDRAASASYDHRYGRGNTRHNRRRITDAQSEYRRQYDGKQPSRTLEDSKMRDQQSNAKNASSTNDPSKKTSVAVNTPARVRIDVDKNKQKANRVVRSPKKSFRPKRDEVSEYRARYTPMANQKTRKAFEAEQIDDRKRREVVLAERAYSDDEGAGRNVDLGAEFRQNNPHGKLKRWKSEYQATYKPFWRFDYKDGKWYKDSAAEQTGFNPNLYWYKELVSTRNRADQFRAKAETDHFNSDHTLQLKTGFGGNKNYQAWDMDDDDDDDSDSVISIDRDLERERIEGERRREKDAKRKEDERIQSKIHYNKQKRTEKPSTTKTDQINQTDHSVNRVVYIDEPPPPKSPSAATKAFVRNLGSSSVQQHMSWDSESLYSQQTNSDIDIKSLTARNLHRKHYGNDHSKSKKQQSRGTGTHSPLSAERQQINNGYTSPLSPQTNERTTQHHKTNITATTRPATSYQETRNGAGRSNYDTHSFDTRPPARPNTSMNEYCTYPGSRFKDEVTEYYYGSDDNRHQHQLQYQYPQQQQQHQHHHQHPQQQEHQHHHQQEHPQQHPQQYQEHPQQQQQQQQQQHQHNYHQQQLHPQQNQEHQQQHEYTPASKTSFQNHLQTLDERFGQTYNKRNKEDDVHWGNSARSLSSSCSLASQTLERAQQNMNKYWGDNSPSSTYSPKKPSSAKH